MFDKSLTLSMLDGKWLKSLEEKSGTVWNVFKLAPEEPLEEQASASEKSSCHWGKNIRQLDSRHTSATLLRAK